MLREALFREDRVVSFASGDLTAQYLPWRVFGFAQVARGTLPFWNPHVLSGAPFVGNFQSALLYPPNWLHLVLSPGHAFDASFAFHLTLAGSCTYSLCRARGASAAGALLAGATFMLSGPVIGQLYPGHHPYVCVIALLPLVFRVAQGIITRPTVPLVLAGSAAVALLALGGHPQPAAYACVAATAYVATCSSPASRMPRLAAWALILVGGAAIAAVQLAAGLAVARESWRSGGTFLEYATSLSLPPENLYSLLVPDLLGNDVHVPYLGGGLHWEVSAFTGVVSLSLAFYGARHGSRPHRRFFVVLAGLALLLALGRYTPVYPFVLRALPAFAIFRVPARFTVLFALAVAVLAADGIDAVAIRSPEAWPAAVAGFVAAALGVTLLRGTSGEAWSRLLEFIAERREMYVRPDGRFGLTTRLVVDSARSAGLGLLVLAGTFAALGMSFHWGRRRPHQLGALLALVGSAELVHHAGHWIVWTRLPLSIPREWMAAIEPLPADARVLDGNELTANFAMLAGFDGVGGYDPAVSGRYGRLLHALEGHPAETFRGSLDLSHSSKALELFRCRAVFGSSGVSMLPRAAPRAFFVRKWVTAPSPETAIDVFAAKDFDPAQRVVLENTPVPAPDPSEGSAHAELRDASTDSVEITADLARAAILVVTDAYAEGWRAEPMEPGAQPTYAVLPADVAARAIPLSAGHHHIRMMYEPRGLDAAVAVSLVAMCTWLCALALVILDRRRGRAARGDARRG